MMVAPSLSSYVGNQQVSSVFVSLSDHWLEKFEKHIFEDVSNRSNAFNNILYIVEWFFAPASCLKTA